VIFVVWCLGKTNSTENVVLNTNEVLKARRSWSRQLVVNPILGGDSPDIVDNGMKEIVVSLGGLVSRSKLNRLICLQNYEDQPIELQEGHLVDDCDATTDWTGANGATLSADTSVYKYGSASIKITGGATDYPYAYSEPTASDWTIYDSMQLWLRSPTTSLPVEVRLGTDASNYDYWDLSVTSADTWEFFELEVNDSGEGDAPSGTSGTQDWSEIAYIEIRIDSATDNQVLYFDNLTLSRVGQSYSGKYNFRKLDPRPVAPVPSCPLWEFDAELVYSGELS